jgi:hypothetical protein
MDETLMAMYDIKAPILIPSKFIASPTLNSQFSILPLAAVDSAREIASLLKSIPSTDPGGTRAAKSSVILPGPQPTSRIL